MRIFYILLGVLTVAAIAAVGILVVGPTLGDGAAAPGEGVVITDEAEVNAHALAFVQPPYRDDFDNLRVAGYVDNLGERELVAATVEIELRNDNGDRIALIEHTVPSVPARERVWFDIDQGTWPGPTTATITVKSVEVPR